MATIVRTGGGISPDWKYLMMWQQSKFQGHFGGSQVIDPEGNVLGGKGYSTSYGGVTCRLDGENTAYLYVSTESSGQKVRVAVWKDSTGMNGNPSVDSSNKLVLVSDNTYISTSAGQQVATVSFVQYVNYHVFVYVY